MKAHIQRSFRQGSMSAQWAAVPNLIGLVGAVGAVAGAIAAAAAAWDARRSMRANQEESAHQGRIALEGLWNEYSSAIMGWANESIDWISRAHSLCLCDPAHMAPGTFFHERAECLWRLSSLIDRGRLLFPNAAPDRHGKEKPEAYRGFSPVVLDQLKNVHEAVKSLNTQVCDSEVQTATAKRIVSCQRQFVSVVQKKLDPRQRDESLASLLARREPVEG